MTPQQVAADFIKKFNGDSGLALEEFSKQAQLKLSSGEVPNEKFTQTSTILEQVASIQDEIDKFGEATKITESVAFNTLVFQRVSGINQLLGEEIYESPDAMTLTQNVTDFEQTLIKMENEMPKIKGPEKRVDTLWVIGELLKAIDSIKGGGQNVNA